MKIAIIGAGAAGLMAAASIQKKGAKITVFEKNEKAGKKIYITGKGRCNFTNLLEPMEFIKSVVSNPKFLYSAIYGFTPSDAIGFFEQNGCKTVVERGNRAFPLSGNASDITKALTNAAIKNGAEFIFNTKIEKIINNGGEFRLFFDNNQFESFDKLVIATGGKSYPQTGSDGDGYMFSKALGHTVIEPRPSLVAFYLKECVKELEGLSLKNVEASLTLNSKKHSEFGEMLFTSKGVSGPIILSLSSYFSKEDIRGGKLSINLKPALDKEMLDKRVLRDFEEFTNKQLKNSLDKLLPKSLILYIIDYAKLDKDKPVNIIKKQERSTLTAAISSLTFTVSGTAGFNEAIVTSGGVNVKEINPSTMESKLACGLYFAGEVMDVDALTGGYNIQIALSTGRLAGRSIS